MGLSMRELMTLDIVARDEASPVVQKVGANVAASGLAYKQASIRALTYSKVLRGLSKGLTIYGTAALAAAAFAGKQAVDFQKQMGLVRTQTDLTDKQFAKLQQSVLDLATKTSRPISELTQGLYDIFSGIDVKGGAAVKMLGQISKAAVSGDTDIRTVTRSVLSELNAFGLGAGKTNMVLDQQFQLLRKSQGTYQELVSSLGNVIASSHQAGQSLTEMNAAIGFLTKSGMSFAAASISVARAMDFITRPEIAAKLKKVLGVDIVDAQGNFKKLSTIMTEMGAKLKGKTLPQMKATLSDIWGNGEIRANRYFNSVLPRIAEYNKNLRETSKFHGALQNAYNKLKDTTSVMWGRTINTIHKVAIEFGNIILPAINKVIAGISKVFAWLDKLPAPVKSTIAQFLIWSGIIAILVGRVARLGAGFLSIVSMKLWSGMAAQAQGATNVISTMGGAIRATAGQFLLWGALIAGVVFLIVKNWSSVQKFFAGFLKWWSGVWQNIWTAIKPIVDFLAHAFREIATEIGAFVVAAGSAIGKFIGWLLSIKPVVQGVVIFLLTLLAIKLVTGIVAAFRVLNVAIQGFLSGLEASFRANWVVLLVAAFVTAAVLIIKNWTKVSDFFAKIFNGIARDAVAVANAFIRYLVNPIIQGLNTIVHAINAVSLGMANITTISPMQPIQMPGKFVSNVGAAAGQTQQAADSTQSLADAASNAGKGISTLNDVIKAYTGEATKAGQKSADINKHISAIKKTMDAQVKSIMQGKSGYIDLNQAAQNLMAGPWGNGKVTNAARLQAAALQHAEQIQQAHLQTILKATPDGKEWAATLANMGDQSLKLKSKTASLVAAAGALNITLSKHQTVLLADAVRSGNLADANKILGGALAKVNRELKGVKSPKPINVKTNVKDVSGQIAEAGQKLNKLGAMNVKPKVSLDAKNIKSQVTEQGKALNSLGKINAKPKVTLDPAVFKREISNVIHMIDTTDKKVAKPRVDASTDLFTTKTRAVASELARLNSTSVNIPIDVHSVSDPYAYGYAIGLKVAAGAKAALQAHSPSKVFIKIGKDVIKGLIIGLQNAQLLDALKGSVTKITGIVKSLPGMMAATFKLLSKGTSAALNTATNSFQKFIDKLDNLKSAIADLRDKIKTHIKDINSKLKDLNKTISDKATKAAEKAKAVLQKTKLTDELKKWMDVSNLPNTMGGVAKKLTSWGNDLQRRMTALNTKVQSFTSDFRSGFQQGTDIVSILGGEDKLSKGKIRQFFASKIRDARRWASTLRQLAKKGLDQNLLQELAAAGPSALPLAKQILDIGVKYVNQQQGTLNKIMGGTQKYLVNTVFGKQIDQLAAEAKRFQDVLKELTKALHDALHPNTPNTPNKPGGGGANLRGGTNLHYHYHAPPNADARHQMRELGWWWRTHRYGA